MFRLPKMICDNLEIWNILSHYKQIKIKYQIEFNIKNNIFVYIKHILISLINIIKASREISLCKWRYYTVFTYIISLCDLQSLFSMKKKRFTKCYCYRSKDALAILIFIHLFEWNYLTSCWIGSDGFVGDPCRRL